MAFAGSISAIFEINVHDAAKDLGRLMRLLNKFESQVKGINKVSFSNLNRSFNAVNKNVKELKRNIEAVNRELDKLNRKMNAIGKASNNLNKAFKDVTKNSKALENNFKKVSDNASNITSNVHKLKRGFKELDKSVRDSGKNIKTIDNNIKSLGNTVKKTKVDTFAKSVEKNITNTVKATNQLDRKGKQNIVNFFAAMDKATAQNKFERQLNELTNRIQQNYTIMSKSNKRLRTDNHQIVKDMELVNKALNAGLITVSQHRKLVRDISNMYGGQIKNNITATKTQMAMLNRYVNDLNKYINYIQRNVNKGLTGRQFEQKLPTIFRKELITLLDQLSPRAAKATTLMKKLEGAFKDGLITQSQYSNLLTATRAGLMQLNTAMNKAATGGMANLDKRFMTLTRSQRMLNYAMQVSAFKSNVFANIRDIGAGIVLGGFINNLIYARYQAVKLDQQMKKFFKTMKNGANFKDFEKSLNAFVTQFPKVSKYAVGATIAQIGKLNNLTQKQMKDLIPLTADLINMMQLNGRTAEDAYLAIADAFDGQFKRLQEIGVQGKEQLKKYGYTGTTDSLIKALTAIGKQKGWSDLRTEITTTEDALQVLGNCIDMVVVPAFNMLAKPMVKIAKFTGNLITGFRKLSTPMQALAGIALIVAYAFGKMYWSMLEARIAGSALMAKLSRLDEGAANLRFVVQENANVLGQQIRNTEALTASQSKNIAVSSNSIAVHENVTSTMAQEGMMVNQLSAMYDRLTFSQKQAAAAGLGGMRSFRDVKAAAAGAANISWLQAGAFGLSSRGVEAGYIGSYLDRVVAIEMRQAEKQGKILEDYIKNKNKILGKGDVKFNREFATPIFGTRIRNINEIQAFNRLSKIGKADYKHIPLLDAKTYGVMDLINERYKEFNKINGITRQELIKNNAVLKANGLEKIKDINITSKQTKNAILAAKATEGFGVKALLTRNKMALLSGTGGILGGVFDKLKAGGSALLNVITAHPYAFAVAAAAAAGAVIWYAAVGQQMMRQTQVMREYYDWLENGEQKIASYRKAADAMKQKESELIKIRNKYKEGTKEWAYWNNKVAKAHENAATMAQKAKDAEEALNKVREQHNIIQGEKITSQITTTENIKKMYEKAGVSFADVPEAQGMMYGGLYAGLAQEREGLMYFNVKMSKKAGFNAQLLERAKKGDKFAIWALSTPEGKKWVASANKEYDAQAELQWRMHTDPSMLGRASAWIQLQGSKLKRGIDDKLAWSAYYNTSINYLKNNPFKQFKLTEIKSPYEQIKKIKIPSTGFGKIKIPQIKLDKIFKPPKGTAKDGWSILTGIFGKKPTKSNVEIKAKTKPSDWGILSGLFGGKKTTTTAKGKPKASAAMVDKYLKTKKELESKDFKKLTPEEKEKRRKKYLEMTRMKEDQTTQPRGFVQQITTSLSGLPVVGDIFSRISGAIGGLLDRFPALRSAFNTIGSVVAPFTGALSRVHGAITRIKSPFDTLKSAVNNVKSTFSSLQDKWNEMVGKCGWAKRIKTAVWDNGLNPLYSKIKEFVNFVKNPFGGAGSNIGAGGKIVRSKSSSLGASGFSSSGGNRGSYSLYKTAAGGIVDNWTSGILNSLRNNGLPAGSPVAGGRRIIDPKECKDERTCYAGIVENWSNYTLNRMKNLPMNIYGYVVKVKDFFSNKLKIFEAVASHIISRTRYEYYYGDRFSNAEAIARGAFNCYDGAQILIELANKLGLSASMGRGYWGNDRHVWAVVGGKTFDTTAFQHGYGWTSPKVKAAGAPSNVTKEVNINITISGNIYGVSDIENVMEKTAKEVFNRMWE